MLVFWDGKFVNRKNAVIDIDNRAFRYGDGFFETMKCVKGRIPLWDLHVDRLFKTLSLLKFECPRLLTPAYLHDTILELINKNQHQRLSRIRLTIYRGDGGIFDDIIHKPNILIQTWELSPHYNFINENGFITGIFRDGFKAADAFANLKTNNYLLYAMAALHAKEQHWNEAMVLNHQGNICDASISNIWIIRDGVVVTPPLSEGPVAGIMRRYLLENLPQAGWKVMESPLGESDIQKADELFVTNAMYGLRWVKEHGGKSYPSFQTARINAQVLAPLWAATK